MQESGEARRGAVERGLEGEHTTVGRLLHELGYRLQSVRKSRDRDIASPDRNAQFEHINSKADDFLQRAHSGGCHYSDIQAQEGASGGFQERRAGVAAEGGAREITGA